jgi:glycerol kinase
VGLGAPHWNSDARGIITGLTRGTSRAHIVRAALEAMAFQSLDVLKAMESDTNIEINSLHVDGGAIANNFLAQFQADILNKPLIRPAIVESTSLGAAYLAGLNAGIWQNTDKLREMQAASQTFAPNMDAESRHNIIRGWHKAIQRTLA